MTYTYPDWWEKTPEELTKGYYGHTAAKQLQAWEDKRTKIQRGLSKSGKEAAIRFPTLLKILRKEAIAGCSGPSVTQWVVGDHKLVLTCDSGSTVVELAHLRLSARVKPTDVPYRIPLAMYWYAALGKPWTEESTGDVR